MLRARTARSARDLRSNEAQFRAAAQCVRLHRDTESGFDPDGPGPQPVGSLITFNYDNPNVKVVGTGNFVNISPAGAPPLYIEVIEPNPEFAAFVHCPKLAG